MRYKVFVVQNFKGIQNLEMDLGGSPPSPVFTLVGLNESGKTTVLEALSFFYEGIKHDDDIALHENSFQIYSLIPKNRQDNFTDSIEIKATIQLENDDINDLKKLLIKEEGFTVSDISSDIEICHSYKFVNSTYIKKDIFFNIDIKGRKKRAKKDIKLGDKDPGWGLVYKEVKKRIPKIIYYPNFLFEFPDKIFLEEKPNEEGKQRFYRGVLQDVLDSIGNDLNLDTHVIQRAKNATNGKPEEKRFLESVLNKMGVRITSTVFDQNLRVFRSDTSNKLITLDYPEQDAEGFLYTKLQLREGEDNYYIRERSLGFKWFFTFLLFTQFRIHRSGDSRIIFLLDEPASNLHQTAQQRLLKSLGSLTSKSVSVIYTTHSHHLINPSWLESTFIVKNKALNYEDDDEKYNSSMTDVSIEKYRVFVANSPEQRTYYQPILDALDYKPSNLENVPEVVMVEGKTDFYTISYFQNIIFDEKQKINILPGMGAGGLDDVIRLYCAWGRNFIILLDSDVEGEKQKKRYKEKFNGLVVNRLFTLGDIDAFWKGKEIEELISKEDVVKLQKTCQNNGKFSKKNLHFSIQELLVNNQKLDLSGSTTNNVRRILEFLASKL